MPRKSSALCLLILLVLASGVSSAADRDVAVYYYPWYDIDRHWQEGYLRSLLLPAQPPELDEYSSRSTDLINQHLDWSESFGIDSWICSWWGPGSWEDQTIRNDISPLMAGRDVSYCLLYESAGLLNLQSDQIFFDESRIATFRSHFQYIGDTYFSDPHYLKVDGRPAVYLYLTRTFTGDYQQALQAIRQDAQALGFELFLIGDEVYWGAADAIRIAELDGITAYNMHGPLQYSGYPSNTNFIPDVAAKYAEYRSVAETLGVAFIPNILPGFNDRAVRLSADHYVIPNQYEEGADDSSTFSTFADMAGAFIDSSLNTVCITSFNEWHEDTQIEPTISTVSTSNDQSGSDDYSQGYSYRGYGTGFLEIVLQKFGPAIPLGFERDEELSYSSALRQNYPNPFNPSTKIAYSLPYSGFFSLRIYDAGGKEIESVLEQFQEAGNYLAHFNASRLSSGVYFYSLELDGELLARKKMVLVK